MKVVATVSKQLWVPPGRIKPTFSASWPFEQSAANGLLTSPHARHRLKLPDSEAAEEQGFRYIPTNLFISPSPPAHN